MFDVANENFHELRVARGEEHAKRMGADVIDDPKLPELQPQTESRCQSPVENGRRSRNAAHQDRLGQRTAHGDDVAFGKIA